MSTIDFYFDIASPYTYLAATQIDQAGADCGAEVVWKPFLLGGVFKATGNTAPAAVAPKASFMLQDLERWAEIYDVPFNFPTTFPINSVPTQRVMTALFMDDPEQMRQLAFDLFDRYWVDGEDVSDAEVLAEAATELGLDGAALLERIGEQEVKDKLRTLTDEAIEAGAFGAPTFVFDGDLYFGNDRIEHVVRAVSARQVT